MRLFLPFALLALSMAAASGVYVRTFYGITHLFHRIPLPKWIKAGVGGMLTGVIAVLLWWAFRRQAAPWQPGSADTCL